AACRFLGKDSRRTLAGVRWRPRRTALLGRQRPRSRSSPARSTAKPPWVSRFGQGGSVQKPGSFLVALGVVGLSWAAIASAVGAPASGGGIAAAGLFLIILGLVVSFPTL